MNTKNKVKKRYSAIKELIERHEIEDQRTLINWMKKKYSIDTNQSIISRDLRTLGVSKSISKGKMVYELPSKDARKEILQLAIVKVEYNESMIIIHTFSGLAAFIGDYLDMCEHTAILGTIAGENVVFVSPRTTKNMKQVYKGICKLLLFKEKITVQGTQ